MKVYGINLAILVCTLVLISGVSAQNVDNHAGYGVTPAGSMYLSQVMSPFTVGTITTGETDWFSASVSPGKTAETADLNWGYAPDSLTLTVIAPDGTLGPYHDADDGVKDGRIFLTFSRAGGIAPGTWNFKVYGENVLGSQSYNFVAY